MDQNQLNNLDPKLREAYERVMGTTTPPGNQTTSELTVEDKPAEPQTQTFTPEPSTSQTDHPVSTEEKPVEMRAPVMPQPAPQTQEPTTTNMFTGNPQVAAAGTQTFLAEEVAGAKQSLKMIQLLYIAGGIIFFVVYALFWMKFFQVTPSF